MALFITLKIHDDPEQRWSGVIRAELTPNGLLLGGLGEDEDYLAPLGCDAQWPCSTYLYLPCNGRTVTFTVAERGVDQVSLARDLANWLQRKQDKIDLANYRLPAYLRLLALLPILVAFAAALTLGTDLWQRDSVWLMIASISGVAVSILMFLWSYAGYQGLRIKTCQGSGVIRHRRALFS